MVPPKNAKGRLVSLRKNRWRGNEDTRREAGDTLVEVLVSLVVIGISATALLGAFATTLSATSDQRSLVGADAFLRSFVETATYDISLSSSPAFVACASSVPAAYSQIASSASNSTYTLTLTGISAPPSGCSTSRPASEQIAVKLASTMGASDSTTFVVYPPSGTAGAGTILNSGTSISPNQGPAAGGTTVTITGNGFTGS